MRNYALLIALMTLFWNVVEGRINMESVFLGTVICFLVYKFNKEDMIDTNDFN
ncbi:hypothetical protein WG909_10560 [Peptostreptococcaceae bacterium AGR-M142]